MSQSNEKGRRPMPRMQILLVLSVVVFATSALTMMAGDENIDLEKYRASLKEKNDSVASVEAWGKVYKVLMHPRCMNCHPSGDIPLQGDDSHIHAMLPERGPEGKGLYAMQCGNCHQNKGVPGEHTPPGNPKWHMPPADMKMVFQGRSAHELAVQMVDFERNGHKTIEDLVEHARDTLVKAGWNMGGDRELPPLSYEEFVDVWDKWIETGAYAPAEEEK